MRLLIVGGTGMLGSIVRRQLALEAGWQVRWTQRRDAAAPGYFDALDSRADCRKLVAADGGADYVFNAVGLLRSEIREDDPASLESAQQVNARLPMRLAEASAELGARFVHVSTDAVFPSLAGPCDEFTAPDPTDLYGQTKLAGEVSRLGALTLRCSMVGPDPEHGRGLYEWLRRLPPGAIARGFADQQWNGVTTLQLASLLRSIIVAGVFDRLAAVSSIRHVCPNAPLTKYDLLLLLRTELRSDARVERCASGVPVTRFLTTRWTDLHELLPGPSNWNELIAELVRADPRGPITDSRRLPRGESRDRCPDADRSSPSS